MKVITIFFLLIFISVEAQNNPKVRIDTFGGKTISLRFKDGRNLIYECDDRHYVCVDDDGYEKCQFIRKNRKIGQFENLGCAPLTIFDEVEDCFEKQKELISTTKKTPFCFKSNFQ